MMLTQTFSNNYPVTYLLTSTPQSFYQTGWMCPKCGLINNPLSSMCANSVYMPIGTGGYWSHL